MEAEVQGSPYLFVNIYAPNKTQDQCRFLVKLNNNIEDCVANKELKIILGGDFNVTLDSDLDCSGGRPFTKDSGNDLAKIILWNNKFICIKGKSVYTGREGNNQLKIIAG